MNILDMIVATSDTVKSLGLVFVFHTVIKAHCLTEVRNKFRSCVVFSPGFNVCKISLSFNELCVKLIK